MVEESRPCHRKPCGECLVDRYLSDAFAVRGVVLNYVFFVVRLLAKVLDELFWRIDWVHGVTVTLLSVPQND